jgi:hypothetical protein
MIRKITGTILLIAGGLLTIVLLTYGGPVFPHIIGPMALAVAGALLLLFKRQAK